MDEDEARRRADLIMQLQAPIMDDFCQSFVGKTIRVLCVGYDEELGRSMRRLLRRLPRYRRASARR
ncbi:MAG: hypothetical protein V8S72_01240 [Oscillospiraceae bacterium]